MTELETTCSRLGITVDALRKRIARGWNEEAMLLPRYARSAVPKGRKPRNRTVVRNSAICCAHSPEQSAISAVMKGWRR